MKNRYAGIMQSAAVWINYIKNNSGAEGSGYDGEYDENLSPEALRRIINNGVDPDK